MKMTREEGIEFIRNMTRETPFEQAFELFNEKQLGDLADQFWSRVEGLFPEHVALEQEVYGAYRKGMSPPALEGIPAALLVKLWMNLTKHISSATNAINEDDLKFATWLQAGYAMRIVEVFKGLCRP